MQDIDEQLELTPRDLIRRFHACSNYPRTDEAACIFLAQDLAKAARLTGVTATEIVNRCGETSTFCPTGADLLAVAREIRDERKRAVARDPWEDWQKEARESGTPPEPFDINGYDHAKAKRCQAEYDELWRVAKGMGLCEGGRWAQDKTILAALRKAGYPKTEHQTKVMKAWEKVA